jgi:hypothetical protein
VTPGQATDSYGDPLKDWDNPVYTLLPGAELQTRLTLDIDQSEASTTTRNGTLIVTSHNAELLAQITPDSRIRQGGDGGNIWRINGQPNVKTGLMYGNTHLTASLTRTTVEAPNA